MNCLSDVVFLKLNKSTLVTAYFNLKTVDLLRIFEIFATFQRFHIIHLR